MKNLKPRMNANGALKHVGVRLTAEVNFQQKILEKYRSIFICTYIMYIYIWYRTYIRKSFVYNVNMFIYVYLSLSNKVIRCNKYVSICIK